jgi:ABC-type transporter Mla MlaB component
MLRITRVDSPDSGPTLKVEGKLMGAWVVELEQAYGASSGPTERPRLDLSAVTFVDASGLRLLHELLSQGASLAACSKLIAELLHLEIR